MKTENRGCLSIDGQFASESAQEALEDAMAFLRDTLESPFVAVVLRSQGGSAQAVVTHGDEIGQFDLVAKASHQYSSESWWSPTTSQPLQWLMEELVDIVGMNPSVEFVDVAVARDELSDADFRRDGEEVLAETEQVKSNRQMAFSGVSSMPNWMWKLKTEPIYDKDEAREAGVEAHREQFAASIPE